MEEKMGNDVNLFVQAEKAFQQRNFDLAIQLLKKLTGNEPGNAQAWFLLAKAYKEKGLIDKALDAITKAKNLDFNNAEIKSFYDGLMSATMPSDETEEDLIDFLSAEEKPKKDKVGKKKKRRKVADVDSLSLDGELVDAPDTEAFLPPAEPMQPAGAVAPKPSPEPAATPEPQPQFDTGPIMPQKQQAESPPPAPPQKIMKPPAATKSTKAPEEPPQIQPGSARASTPARPKPISGEISLEETIGDDYFAGL